MKYEIKSKKFFFFILLLLFLFLLGASFVLARPSFASQNLGGLVQNKELEVKYPEVPGAEAPTTKTALPDYVKYIFNFSIIMGGLVAFGVFILGGAKHLTSAGDPTKMSDARDQIFSGILGLVILLSSYLILTTINPQLVILKLPGMAKVEAPEHPEIKPPEKQTLTSQEIPVGTLINGGDYSDYQGVLDQERMELLKEIVETIKENSFKIKQGAENLKTFASQCNCKNTRCCPGTDCDCLCLGEPCPNRKQMDETRLRINSLSLALEVFVKKEGKLRDFLKDFPPPELLESLVPTGLAEYCNLVAALAMSVRQRPTHEDFVGVYKTCLMEQLNIPLNPPPEIEEMAKIEEKGGEIVQIKEDMEKDLERLEEGKKMMQECFGAKDSQFFTLMSDNNFWNHKEALEYKLKLVKQIKIERAWGEIDAKEDPATFYCSQELIDVSLLKGEISTEEIQTQLEGIEAKEPKIICEPEIPIGKIIDDTIILAKKIIKEIDNVTDYAFSQKEPVLTITRLTGWDQCPICGNKFPCGFNDKGGAIYCLTCCEPCGCFLEVGSCQEGKACPMVKIGSALKAIKNNLGCFLSKPGFQVCQGEFGVRIAQLCDPLLEEALGCCENPPCNVKFEGSYFKMEKYYNESQQIIKNLEIARKNLTKCTNSAEDLARAMLGEKILEKELFGCDQTKLNLSEKKLIKQDILNKALDNCPDSAELKEQLSTCEPSLFYFPKENVCEKDYFCCDEFNYFCCQTD